MEIQPLSPQQARAFVQAAQGDPLEALFILAITSGMRQGEMLGLKWGDIDFQAGKLQVRRSIGRVAGKGWIEQAPKTEKGRRSLTLSPLAAQSLREHRTRQAAVRLQAGSEWDARDLVFCNALGRPIEEPNLRLRSFKPLLVKAGLPDIRFHDLRHSAATLMFALNTHPKVVQQQLGHSNISITLDIYSHAVPELQAEAVAKLDAFLAAN